MTPARQLGRLLALERHRHGWTRDRLAKEHYLFPWQIEDIEAGRSNRPEAVIDLLIALSAPFSVLAEAHRLIDRIRSELDQTMANSDR